MDQVPIQLSDASGVPYYRQITDQLAQLVRSGQLPPQTRLPSVRDLAGQLLVSLITVRRSYADLEAASLIVRRQGQGTFVAELIETASREQALSEARALLSGAVAGAGRLGVDKQQIERFVSELLSEEEKNNE